jgi:hypothetical protein
MCAIEQRLVGCRLLQLRPIAQNYVIAQFGLQLRHASGNSCAAGIFIAARYFFQRRFALDHGDSFRSQLRLGAKDRFHGKIRNVDACERHKNRRWSFVFGRWQTSTSATDYTDLRGLKQKINIR